MNGKERLVAAIKLALAVSAAALTYALLAVTFNEITGEGAHLEVVSGAIWVAVAGSFSVLFLWLYVVDRRKRE